jgi:hypothetical protein
MAAIGYKAKFGRALWDNRFTSESRHSSPSGTFAERLGVEPRQARRIARPKRGREARLFRVCWGV